MLIVPRWPRTRSTSSRCSGVALSASIRSAILASCSIVRSRIPPPFPHLYRSSAEWPQSTEKHRYVPEPFMVEAGTKRRLNAYDRRSWGPGWKGSNDEETSTCSSDRGNRVGGWLRDQPVRLRQRLWLQ